MISAGLRVKVDYRGTLDDGTEFDSTYSRGEPLEFVLGQRTVLPSFERAVACLSEGASCKIRIPAVDAYGFYNEGLVDEVPVDDIAHAERLPVGSYISLRGEDGRPVRAKVLEVRDGIVRFDYNHPLAGKDLDFEIELLEVERRPAIEQEKHPALCSCHRVQSALGSSREEACACGHSHAHA